MVSEKLVGRSLLDHFRKAAVTLPVCGRGSVIHVPHGDFQHLFVKGGLAHQERRRVGTASHDLAEDLHTKKRFTPPVGSGNEQGVSRLELTPERRGVQAADPFDEEMLLICRLKALVKEVSQPREVLPPRQRMVSLDRLHDAPATDVEVT